MTSHVRRIITALGAPVNAVDACRQFRSWAILGLAIFAFASSVRADEQPPATAVSTTLSNDVVTGEPFPRGLRVITLYGGYEQQPNGTRAQIGFCSLGLNYYFANNWAFGFEATGLGCSQPQDNVGAGGADMILRTHLWNYRRFSFYGDFAAGVLEANNRIPPSGTDFNFTIQSGVGAVYRLNEQTELMFGVRDFHLSNARQDGPDRNPSLNGIQGYMGLMFRR
ncbi:MAG: acyloxyacyl hydrolase [Tepidisphaeraceae bacterium]|jgi:hypothetical protein